MRDTFIRALIDIAEKDSRVVLLTGDLGFGVVEKFAEKYPDRFWNCGVAEQSMMSIAAGLAKSGLRPFVYSIANFPTFRCLEQIRNDVCYHNLPVTIVSVGGGLGYGTLGYTHHGIEDISVLRPLPNISIYSPADPSETKDVLSQIVLQDGPAYLRLGKNGEPEIKENTSNQLTGSIRELTDGSDLTVLSTGAITFNCLIAAKELINEMKIQLISVPKVQPISYEYLFQLIASPKVLVVEEHVERGGFASAILESMNSNNRLVKFHHVFISQYNISQTGSQEYLRKLSGLDPESLKATFRILFKN